MYVQSKYILTLWQYEINIKLIINNKKESTQIRNQKLENDMMIHRGTNDYTNYADKSL